MDKRTAIDRFHCTLEDKLGIDDSYASVRRMKPETGQVDRICPSDMVLFEQRRFTQLRTLMRELEKFGITRIVLEGAHIYGDETPNEDHLSQMRETALLREFLMARGCNVTNVLFIDDFHPEHSTLDIVGYVAQARLQGWPIDEVMFERDMVPVAMIIIDILKQIDATLEKDGALVVNRNGGTHLLQPDTRQPSCALLDAAFSALKYQLFRADAIVNVLPRGMKMQQKSTRTILGTALDVHELPFYNLYVEPNNPDK